jgi:hypothetical protein
VPVDMLDVAHESPFLLFSVPAEDRGTVPRWLASVEAEASRPPVAATASSLGDAVS